MTLTQPSTLLTLPPELRNRIYELVLISPGEELIMRHWPAPPLLRTCHQIRAEASSIYYSQNTFLVPNAEEDLLSWLKSIAPALRKYIRTVRLHMNCTSTDASAVIYRRDLLIRLYREVHRLGAKGVVLGVFRGLDRGAKPLWMRIPARDPAIHW